MASVNPFERIRSTEGKVFLLLAGLALLMLGFDLARAWMGPRLWIGVTETVVVLAYVAIGTIGTMQIVARPVRRAVDHFVRISGGDYGKPVLTRRTDEFGDMLRALDQMRINLADAVAARDAAERRYREIVERSVQGFFQTTEDGHIVAANDALAQLLGFASSAALLAEPRGLARRLYVDPTRRAEYIRQLQLHGAVTGFESALRRRDGRVMWVSQSARVVRDKDGAMLYLEGFLDDVTARKESEQLKADFVSFVTHQLRTPLSGIRWMLELAAADEKDAEVASFIADAHASAQRLIGLVNDLLDVARLESGRVMVTAVAVDVCALIVMITRELTPLATAKLQHIAVSGAGVPPVYADPQLLRQALLNLLSNAIKYTPDGGRITVHTERHDDCVRCSVQDTGIGIPEGAQTRLFEKFYRAANAATIDTEGTGLGLYLVKLIAERSGGSIACESKEREGSVFTLTLPVAPEAEAVA